ncbi:hypothetical protein SUGI_1139930 [Cryptomeria japonica]|nr:hypothetical protein SUGI_1139930 [Cryptomeria japonica]
MAKRSDSEMKFVVLFMVVVIVGGTIMADAQGLSCNCATDDDCPASVCCMPGTCDGNRGFCCDPNPFVPPDELTN